MYVCMYIKYMFQGPPCTERYPMLIFPLNHFHLRPCSILDQGSQSHEIRGNYGSHEDDKAKDAADMAAIFVQSWQRHGCAGVEWESEVRVAESVRGKH